MRRDSPTLRGAARRLRFQNSGLCKCRTCYADLLTVRAGERARWQTTERNMAVHEVTTKHSEIRNWMGADEGCAAVHYITGPIQQL